MAWVKGKTNLYIFMTPSSRVVADRLQKVLLPTGATLGEGVSHLSHLLQPQMRKQREQHAGIMEMWPRLHICRLSSFFPALAQNLRCGGKPNLHTEVASDCPQVGASIRVTCDLSRPVTKVIDAMGCKPIAVMFIGGTKPQYALRREMALWHKIKRGG